MVATGLTNIYVAGLKDIVETMPLDTGLMFITRMHFTKCYRPTLY